MAVKLFMSGVRPISTYDKMLLCEQAPTQHFVICVCMAELLNHILKRLQSPNTAAIEVAIIMIMARINCSFTSFWLSSSSGARPTNWAPAVENGEIGVAREIGRAHV